MAMGCSAPFFACHQDPAESPQTAAAPSASTEELSGIGSAVPLGTGVTGMSNSWHSGGSCPTGNYCVKQPRQVAADAGAPAPYAACAAVAYEDEDPDVDAGPFAVHARRSLMISFDAAATRAARDKGVTQCCYSWVQPCPGGRPLRDGDGEVVAAGASARRDWALTDVWQVNDGSRATAEATSERWLREAASEHASIASFACVAHDLVALGAPLALVAAAHRAAADENPARPHRLHARGRLDGRGSGSPAGRIAQGHSIARSFRARDAA